IVGAALGLGRGRVALGHGRVVGFGPDPGVGVVRAREPGADVLDQRIDAVVGHPLVAGVLTRLGVERRFLFHGGAGGGLAVVRERLVASVIGAVRVERGRGGVGVVVV